MTRTSWPKTSFSTSTTKPSASANRWLQFTVTAGAEQTVIESDVGEKHFNFNVALPFCALSSCSWRLASPTSCLPCWWKIWRPWTRASWGARSPPARNRRWWDFTCVSTSFSLSSFNHTYLFSFFPGDCCFPQITTGLLLANSQVIFEKAENSPINLIGEFLQHTSTPDWCLLTVSDGNDEK